MIKFKNKNNLLIIAMNRTKAVAHSKSSNSPLLRRSAQKKSWSSGEVANGGTKRRGKRLNSPPVSPNRPPNSQFLSTVLNMLSQESNATQFPEDSQEKPVSHKRVRILSHLNVTTTDVATQDMDAIYSRDSSPNTEYAPSVQKPLNKPARRKTRFRSRALNSNLNDNLKLDEPESSNVSSRHKVVVQIPPVPYQNPNLKMDLEESVEIIKSELNQIQAQNPVVAVKISLISIAPTEQSIYVAPITHSKIFKDIPEEKPPEQAPKKSKVRIVEPDEVRRRTDDESDAKEQFKKKSATGSDRSATSDGQFHINVSIKPANGRPQSEKIPKNNKTEFTGYDFMNKNRNTWNQYNNRMRNNPLSYTPNNYYIKVPTINKSDSTIVGRQNPYVNFMSDYTGSPTRMFRMPIKHDYRKPKLIPKSESFWHQNKRKAKGKKKEKDHPLLKLLKIELEMEPDWYVEPSSMHESLLKALDEKKRTRSFIHGTAAYNKNYMINNYYGQKSNRKNVTFENVSYLTPSRNPKPQRYFVPSNNASPKRYDYNPPNSVSSKRQLSPTASVSPAKRYLSPTGSVSPPRSSLSPTGSVSPAKSYLSPTGSISRAKRYLSPSGSVSPAKKYLSPTGRVSPAKKYLSPTGRVSPAKRYLSTTGRFSPANRYLSPTKSVSPAKRYLSPTKSVSSAKRYLSPTKSVSSAKKYLSPTGRASNTKSYASITGSVSVQRTLSSLGRKIKEALVTKMSTTRSAVVITPEITQEEFDLLYAPLDSDITIDMQQFDPHHNGSSDGRNTDDERILNNEIFAQEQSGKEFSEEWEKVQLNTEISMSSVSFESTTNQLLMTPQALDNYD